MYTVKLRTPRGGLTIIVTVKIQKKIGVVTNLDKELDLIKKVTQLYKEDKYNEIV